MNINSFQKQDKLYTRKNVFDRVTNHVIKNAMVPIMQNKLLGVKAKKVGKADSKKEMDEFKKKQKILLGDF